MFSAAWNASVRHMDLNVLLQTDQGNVAVTYWTCILRHLFKSQPGVGLPD